MGTFELSERFVCPPPAAFAYLTKLNVKLRSMKQKNEGKKKSKSTTFFRSLLRIQGPTWLFNTVQVHWSPPPTQHLAHTYWPADVVSSAAPHLRQTAGFFWHLIWAARHDGLASSLRARHIAAGTEQQLMCVFRGHAVKKTTQGLVAAGTVAQTRFAWRLDTRWNIFSAQPLAQVVHIAGFGSVQAPVCCRKAQIRVCKRLEKEHYTVCVDTKLRHSVFGSSYIFGREKKMERGKFPTSQWKTENKLRSVKPEGNENNNKKSIIHSCLCLPCSFITCSFRIHWQMDFLVWGKKIKAEKRMWIIQRKWLCWCLQRCGETRLWSKSTNKFRSGIEWKWGG